MAVVCKYSWQSKPGVLLRRPPFESPKCVAASSWRSSRLGRMACQGNADDDVGIAAKTHFVFVPLMYTPHLIPAVDTALLLATHGALSTIVVTPSFTERVRPTVDFARESGLPVRLVELPLDCVKAGLPHDDIDNLPPFFMANYMRATALLREPLERHLRAHLPRPTCIVSDSHAWTVELAANLKVPRLNFMGFSAFNLMCNTYYDVDEASKPAAVPDDAEKRRTEVMRALAPEPLQGPASEKLVDDIDRARVAVDGIVVNTFLDMESQFVDECAKIRGTKVWAVGPVSLVHRHAATAAARGNAPAIDAGECLRWLEGKERNSVVYASFGSVLQADPRQVMELGLGLEASGQPFIWAFKNAECAGEVGEFLQGLEARVAGRGLVIRGWAPQLLILGHAAVGGILTHCGWNSTMEAIAAGLPMATWPLTPDQVLNERLAVEYLGIGVSVGAMWLSAEMNEPVLVERGAVEKAVRSIMDGEEAEQKRRRAWAIARRARAAVKEGGSSFANLRDLVKRYEATSQD